MEGSGWIMALVYQSPEWGANLCTKRISDFSTMPHKRERCAQRALWWRWPGRYISLARKFVVHCERRTLTPSARM